MFSYRLEHVNDDNRRALSEKFAKVLKNTNLDLTLYMSFRKNHCKLLSGFYDMYPMHSLFLKSKVNA